MNEFGNTEELNLFHVYSANVPAGLTYSRWDALRKAYDAYCIVRYLYQCFGAIGSDDGWCSAKRCCRGRQFESEHANLRFAGI